MMEPTQVERRAMDVLWQAKTHGSQTRTEADDAQMLEEVRMNVRQAEQEALTWLNRKMARPPRSGLWSNYSPTSVGWIFVTIVVAVLVIAIVIALFGPNLFRR